MEAIFALVVLAAPLSDPSGELRFRGLDPDLTYHVTPVVVGAPPSGLRAPLWWGSVVDDPAPRGLVSRALDGVQIQRCHEGGALTGASLMYMGVQAPRMHPEQAVLFLLSAAAV